ncbi:MAG: S9 family peptidase, partial [Phycisphaerales bacterium]
MLFDRSRLRNPLVLGIALASAAAALAAAASPPIIYPKTRTVDQTDEFHGVKVADPYRWLEESPEESADLRAWISAQNKLTFGLLEQIQHRDAIKQRITKLWDYEKYGTPYRDGGRYFYSYNNGLQNQNVIYTMKSLEEEAKVLIDPNTFSADGTVSLSGSAVSDDGRYFAYGISDGGSDWQEWKIREIESGKDLDDRLKWVKFSGASWLKDGSGFYYSRYDEPTEEEKLQKTNYFHKLCFHKVGTPQSEDKVVYERPDQKEWGFGGQVTDDGRYLIINVWKGTERKNLVFYRDLQDPDAPVVELIKQFEAQFNFIDNHGPLFWFTTDLDAPRLRVVMIDTLKPRRENWKEIIPQSEDTLDEVTAVGNTFIAQYLHHAHSVVKQFDLNGKHIRDIDLPGIGSAGGFRGKRSDDETFYSFTGFIDPPVLFRYDVKTGKNTVFKRADVDFNPGDYETKQVFYNGKDGTRIPMFITSKKGLTLSGDNPTLLYGYGGFNISIMPGFSVANLVWMEMGGIYAVANIRGGGEYGRDWHEAGMKLTKQNCFDDFIAAAEWLIENKYTSSSKLAIFGGSNGGLLVGACITQRPELFGAALPAVGVLDMLRFHKFTIGWAWVSDYGSVDNADEFKALYAYSPYHNVKPGASYPATLITTGDHDDRVVPAHSFKFAAALQKAQSGPAPILIR